MGVDYDVGVRAQDYAGPFSSSAKDVIDLVC